jgi:hypothetical protein
MAAAKPIYYPASETPLTREEIAQVFGRIGKKDTIAIALRQILVERLAQATIAAAERDENAPGRIEELIGLQGEFATLLDEGAALRKSGKSAKNRQPSATVGN